MSMKIDEAMTLEKLTPEEKKKQNMRKKAVKKFSGGAIFVPKVV